jgi:hypothetical protein
MADPLTLFQDNCREMLGQDPETVAHWFDEDEAVAPFMKEERGPLRDRMLNVYAAGLWLHAQLHESGVAEKDAEDACFAAGQMMVMAPNPWVVAELQRRRVVDEGVVVIPGPGLAEALLSEKKTVQARPREQ